MSSTVDQSVPLYEKRPSTSSRSSPCVVCGIELLRYTSYRAIPDYLCKTCYDLWSTQLDSDWMKWLKHQERYRRLKAQRQAKAGIFITQVSLEVLIEEGTQIAGPR